MQTEPLPDTTALPAQNELGSLLEAHATTELDLAHYERMCALLEAKVGYGNPIPDLICPDCGRAIVFTWNWGASACLYMHGGCGRKIGRPMNRSQCTLTWESYLSKRPG